MPNHKCGQNGYTGIVDVQIASNIGLLDALLALFTVMSQASAEVQAVYNRACPNTCNACKTGLVAYRIASVRAVTLGAFEDPAIPAGLRKSGYQIVIEWRLKVQCEKKPPNVSATPTVIGWDELQQILIILWGEDFQGKLAPVNG